MPNKNYISGRRLEYEVIKMLRNSGMEATRTAGSHGWVDVVAKFKKKFSEAQRGWEKQYKGFTAASPVNNPMKLIRNGKTYIDTLYVWVYRDNPGWLDTDEPGPWTAIHLIQCKRKKVK